MDPGPTPELVILDVLQGPGMVCAAVDMIVFRG